MREKYILKLIVISIIGILFLSLLSAKTKIAILDFECSSLSQQELNALTDRFCQHLHDTGLYTIIERRDIAKILEEIGLQQTITSDDEALSIGKMLGAEQIVFGSIMPLPTSNFVTVRLVSTETGVMINGESVEITGGIPELLRSGLNKVVLSLIKSDQEEDQTTEAIEAPYFSLLSNTGEYEQLYKWSGKILCCPLSQPERHVVLLAFFATWCKPCIKELPYLQNFYGKYKDEKIKFFLVDITEATRYREGFEDHPKAEPFLENLGITIPILFDVDGIVMERYEGRYIPRQIIIDKYGIIRWIKRGFNEGDDFAKDKALIDQLLLE
jgi:thiol-disulfide isomerase/thioredoxin